MTTINHEVNEMLEAEDNMIATHEALIKDLTDIVKSANAGEADLNKAKDKATKNSDRSIRDLATRVAAINEDLPSEAIAAICDSVADKIANGNASVKKARKSELKLCLEQRTHIGAVIKEIDEANKERGGDNQPRKLNMRSATLGALRVVKKDKVTPRNAVDKLVAKTDHVKSVAEKLQDHLTALSKSDKLKVDGETHPDARRALDALSAAVLGDFGPLEALSGPVEEEDPQDAEAELMAEAGFEEDDLAVPEDAEPAAVEVDHEYEEPTPVPEPVDDDFDIDAIIGGLT